MEFKKFKFFITSYKDNRSTEITEDMWDALSSRSDMDKFSIAHCGHPSEEIYANIWIGDKLHSCDSFNAVIELFVRELHFNLASAKDFAQKVTSVEPDTLVRLGRL